MPKPYPTLNHFDIAFGIGHPGGAFLSFSYRPLDLGLVYLDKNLKYVLGGNLRRVGIVESVI